MRNNCNLTDSAKLGMFGAGMLCVFAGAIVLMNQRGFSGEDNNTRNAQYVGFGLFGIGALEIAFGVYLLRNNLSGFFGYQKENRQNADTATPLIIA